MILIPNDKYEQDLTDWFSGIAHSDGISEEDRKAAHLLLHLSKAQMVERNRGEEYPFIDKFKLTSEEYDLIEKHHWTASENIEVKDGAYEPLQDCDVLKL
jgi:hypothetical protein